MARIATRFGLGVVGAGAVVASLISVVPAQAAPLVPAAPVHVSSSDPFDLIASLSGTRGGGGGTGSGTPWWVKQNQQLMLKDCSLDTRAAATGRPERDVSLVGPYSGQTAECLTGGP